MGSEYYLIKPEKQEIFYLGKHMNCPEGIHTFSQDAHWINYYSFNEFFFDFLEENLTEFLCMELTLEETRSVIYKIYEWCRDDKVYFDHDCNDEAPWLEWKETGSLMEILEKVNTIKDVNTIIRSKKVELSKEDLAKYLFDGDEEKAKILLELIQEGAVDKIETIFPLEMNLPDEDE